MIFTPEKYVIPPNQYAPNSSLPVLIYREALPLPLSEEKTTAFLESHDWEKRGVWGHIPVRHFHPNSHECYATVLTIIGSATKFPGGIFQGTSTLLLGCGASDEDGGLEVAVGPGDVVVLPAGTAHCCLESSKDYRYIGVYPKGCPRWRNELGKDRTLVSSLREEVETVALPAQDPVNGPDGPLLQLWVGARAG